MSGQVAQEELTTRQSEVLDAALGVLLASGDRLTMSGVARAASCSKESLYKWFADRDGLLTAIVQHQAAKVRMPRLDKERLDRASLETTIAGFGRDLLSVLASPTSVALNRLAIAHAGGDKANLGRVVLENGRRAMGRRLKPVLEAGRECGLLTFEDCETAFRTFFGLIVRDVQIRLLLGDALELRAAEVDADAARAAEQFFVLYGRKVQ